MNRAAEHAIPEAAAVLGESVKQMSITDAKSILTGTNNAATQYFRRTSETNLCPLPPHRQGRDGEGGRHGGVQAND
jgi:hypothetical protein